MFRGEELLKSEILWLSHSTQLFIGPKKGRDTNVPVIKSCYLEVAKNTLLYIAECETTINDLEAEKDGLKDGLNDHIAESQTTIHTLEAEKVGLTNEYEQAYPTLLREIKREMRGQGYYECCPTPYIQRGDTEIHLILNPSHTDCSNALQ